MDALRYTVQRDGATDVFWFSPQHPGMPVRFTSGGVTVTVVADEVW